MNEAELSGRVGDLYYDGLGKVGVAFACLFWYDLDRRVDRLEIQMLYSEMRKMK